MSQSYEEMYQESLQELPPLDQVIIDNNLVSTFTKKLISTTRSAKEQMAILEERGLQKQLDITGYLEGTIISSSDADSGIYKDANGDIRNYRFADLNPIDAIDKEKARLNSAYKSRLQPKFVSALTGKPIEQLENSDYDNVARYQHIQEQSAFLNKDYTFTPYNKDQIYDTPKSTTIPFAYKVVGQDSNGRDLIEAINPATGRQVSFDMSNNPYLNASFDLYKSIDSEYNRDRLEQYEIKNSNHLQRLAESFDTDGRLKENLDIVQSSAYQSAARLLQHLPDSIVDEKKWESVANANTGQQLADAWAGVKTSTRRDFAKGMIEASNEFDKGNYADAVIGWGSQLDRLLAESATQMGLMAAGTLATGGLAAGAGTAAKIGAAFLGAVPAGIDKTLSTMEQYKANNQGREMDGEEVAKAFALNTATLIPEAFLMGINFTKLLPRNVGNSLVKTYASKANAMSRLQTVGVSTVGEAGQEGLEGATESWLAQDQTKSKSFTEHLLSADTAKEAIIGGMMGGVLSGTANVTGSALSSIPTSKLNKNIEAIKEQYNTYTPTGSTANPEDSNTLINVVENTPIESATTDTVNAKMQELQKAITDNPNARTAAIDKAKATQIEIAKQALLDEKNIIDRDSFLQAIGKSKEELFEEIVLYSGLGKDEATVVRQDGKQYDEATTKAVKEELYKVAEKLGIDKETANKSMELVDYEVKHGVNGYLHFKEQIDNISSKLKDTSLSSEERANLEAKRTAWSTRLSFLYNNQLDKLKQFAEHAAILEGGNTASSSFTFKSGEGKFNLKSEYLATKSYDSGYGSHGVVQKVYEQAKSLKDIISSLPENVIKELSTIPNKDISIDLTNDSLDTYLESYKKSSDNIFKGVEERATKRLETKPLTDKTIISKLKSLTSDKLSPSGRAKLEGEVRASLSKQEGSIRDYINNSTIKEEVKSNIIKELDRIKGVKETVDTRITEVQSKEEKELQTANDFSIEVADNIIKTIDKKDIPELQKEIEKVASPLRTHKSKEANTLLQVYREVYSELNDRLKEVPIEDVKEDSSTLQDTTVSTTERTSTPIGTKESPIQVYSDGSHIKGTDVLGYGAVFIHNDKEYTLSGTNEDEVFKQLQGLFPDAKLSNPTMEMLALAVALETFAETGIAEHIQINQDYKGTVNYGKLWDYSKGSLQREPKPWKAKESYIIHLVDKAVKAIEQIESNGGSVTLNWVKGHQKAGTEQAKMNDLADKQAKSREIRNDLSSVYSKQKSSNITTVSNTDKITDSTATPATNLSNTEEKQERNINGVDVEFIYGDKAVATKNGIIIPSSVTKDFLNINKKLLGILESFGIDYQQLVSKLNTKEEIENFVLLHEYRHMQQIQKRESHEIFNKEYKKNPGRFEIDALLYPLHILNLIDLNTYKEANRKFKLAIEKADNSLQSKEELEALAEMEKEVVKEDTQQVDNIKDYASNTLLDPDTNNSVTFLPRFFTEQGKSFDLRNEIKLSRSPASKIATIGADSAYVDKVKSAMKNIFLNLEFKKEGNKVEKIISSLDYFTKSSDGGYVGMWKEAPHLRLLYNFIIDRNNITFEPNDNVIAAIDLSLKEFFSINGKETFNPNSMTKGNLVGMYGYNSSTVTDEQYLQIRDVVSKYGIIRAKLESELGTLILDNLGLRANLSKGTVGFFEEVTQGLGMFAIQYAKELDYVTETIFDSDAWSADVLEKTGKEEKHAIKYNTPHIKFNSNKASRIIDEFSGIKNKEGKRTGGLKDKYKLKDTRITKPRMSKQQLPSDMTVRGTKGIMNIPSYVNKVLQKLWNTPYTVNIDLVKLVLQNKKAILARLDYMEDYKSNTDLTYDEVISQEGINAGIDREFKKLMEISKASVIAEKLGKASKFYFKWFMSKNMRIFMDTSEANPQVGKSLQRFLIMPEAINRSYRIEATTKEEQVELHNDQVVLYTAIAQAFDSMKSEERITLLGQALEKFTLEELKELQSEVINKDVKEWDKKYTELYEYTNSKGEVVKKGLEGLENLGHALLVLQHLIKVQEAKASNKSTIESYLAVENDSTTSGYFLRMLAFPDPTILKNFAAKVGILQKGSSLPMVAMHNLKETDGFYDIYKTIAKLAYANLEGITDNFYTYEYNGKVVKTKYLDNFKPEYDKTDTEEESREKRIQAEIFTNIYLKMNDALPKPEEDGSIGSALRKLLKSPSVIFGYTAGREAVSRDVANDIMWDFIKTYMKTKKYKSLEAYIEENKIKESEQSKLKSIYSTMAYIERSAMDDNETLYTQLKKKSVTEIWLYVGNSTITLNNLFEELLAPTYGNAVWEALSTSFGNHNKFNDSMNMMFTHMFQLFEKEFNKEMSKLTDTYGADIPLTEERNAIESLFDLFPTVRLVYSNNVNESMMLMDTEKYRNANPKDKKYKVTSPISKDGITESTTSAANVRRFINAGKAGAVIPIHAMDGMAMAMVLDKFPNVIPVHDAIVMSAKDNKKITQEYNKLAFLLAKDFNLYDEIVGRYIEVLKTYDERNGKTGEVYKEQLVDAYGKKQMINNDTPLLTRDFIKDVLKYNRENNNNRNKFYSEPVFISNMDGIEGSGIVINPNEHLDDVLFKQALDTWEGWSNPETYRTDNDITYRLQQANVDVKERVALFDDLQTMSEEMGNKVENKSHLDYLKDMVSKINPIHINKLVVEYSKSQDFNVGMLKGDVVTIGFDNKTEIDNITRLSPFSDKSPAEIYAHELVHASIRYAFANKKLYGFNKEINQLMTLQKAASKVTTWEDFMPTKYDAALQSVYEKHAKDLWNYIFNNPDTTSLRGLHEFVAHGLTNEVLMDKLKNNYIVSKNTGANDKLLDKLLTIVRSIFDVVFGKEKFSVAFDVASEILKGNIPILYKKTLFKELEILTSKITQANTKASDKLFEQPLKFVEMLFSLIGKGVFTGNKYVSPIIKYTLNLADNLGYPKGWQVYAETSKLDRVKALANITVFSLISEARRKALPTWLREVLSLSQQGVIQTIFREVSEPDKQTSRLDQLSTLTRMVEQTSKGLETIAMFDLLDKFGKKELTLEESTSLTTVLLQTDLSSLLEYDEENKTSNIDSILELINDKHKLNSSIEELENILMKDKNGIYYVNQSLALAYYMTTGKGNSALLLNAHNIAMNRLSNNPINATEETINSIDKLTSLYALRMTTNEHRITISNLKKEGIENYLITHKNFVKDSLNGIEVEDNKGVRKTVRTLESIHAIKGYHKQLLDTSFDIEVDFLGNEEERRKEGFFIIKDGKTNITLEENPVTGMNDLVVYKRTFATPNRRDGSGFISIGAKAKGATLKESTNEILAYKKNVSYEEISDRHRVYYKKATSLLKQMNNRMNNNNILSLSKIKRMSKESGAYIPILSPLGHDNGVSDFRITMSHAFKIEHLGMDLNGLKILSKMYATQNTKAYASIKNKELVSFLKRDMENNMNPTTRKDTEGHRYILLARSTDNKFLQDAWDFIPKELKDEVRKGHFFVREDWLQDLLGVPSTSLNELEVVNKLAPTQVKRGIAIGEYIMKMIAYMAKQNTIIRVPAVLVGNIVSNFNYSVANGSNPFKVLKKTMENTRNIRDYMDNKKELNIIQFRKRLGTATEKELNQINWYLAKLEHNPIHSLMQKGMYQAIVEDINTDELESIGKINQFIKNSKLSKYVPASIRWISKQLYMTEGTAIYDFMFQTTQYSDFVARATEYQLKMEKAPTKYKETIKDGKKVKVITEEYLNYEEALTIDIWNAFINYDKPQSTLEQYLNDIGILMFTKYFKRIQHMIVKGLVNNPVGVMAFLFTQSFLHNPEHIYEQNVFNKSVLSLFHSPAGNFVNAITPMPLQYYLGMRKLSL